MDLSMDLRPAGTALLISIERAKLSTLLEQGRTEWSKWPIRNDLLSLVAPLTMPKYSFGTDQNQVRDHANN